MSGRVVCRAGTRPNRAPATTETPSVNARTWPARRGSSATGIGSGRSAVASRSSSQTASPVPTPPTSRLSSVVLRQQPPHQRTARGAERQTHSDLLAPLERARKQEAADIGAGQQHEPDDLRQHPRGGTDEGVHRREQQHVGERQDREPAGRLQVLDAVPVATCAATAPTADRPDTSRRSPRLCPIQRRPNGLTARSVLAALLIPLFPGCRRATSARRPRCCSARGAHDPAGARSRVRVSLRVGSGQGAGQLEQARHHLRSGGDGVQRSDSGIDFGSRPQ